MFRVLGLSRFAFGSGKCEVGKMAFVAISILHWERVTQKSSISGWRCTIITSEFKHFATNANKTSRKSNFAADADKCLKIVGTDNQ